MIRGGGLNVYDRPWLLLCEGDADKKFFDRLIEAHNIPATFKVEFVKGRGDFGNRLSLLHGSELSESFKKNVQAVLVVADKDDDGEASFKDVQAELKKADFPIPTTAGVVAKKKGYPDTVILMLPIRTDGNLETLCLPALFEKWAIRSAVDAFLAATPASTWGIGKQSKMRLNATLAATCEPQPDTSFAWHWNFPYHCLPIDHDCFEEVVQFLQNFPTILNPPGVGAA